MGEKMSVVDEERIHHLNNLPPRKGKFVLYWMQSSQRTSFNHALTYAIEKANELSESLLVLFVIKKNYPELNLRHYAFMLEGLRDVWENLSKKGIRFIVKVEDPLTAVKMFSNYASLVVTDTGYLGTDRQLTKSVSDQLQCALIQIESDVVVPVEVASSKEEYTAFTIRRKIKPNLPRFLKKFEENELHVKSHLFNFTSFDVRNPTKALKDLSINKDVLPSESFKGGENEAHIKLKDFVVNKLSKYSQLRNDPLADVTSNLSPYLSFGQISPIEIALEVLNADHTGKTGEQFIEELIIRRELAVNFVYYNKRYRSLDSVPDWAQKTLAAHTGDEKKYVYSVEDFENANTHDVLWNAAQTQLLKTGKIHGYVRIYWGKKILEWAESPEKAYKTAVYLNNKYALDGNTPNSFAGVAWCFGKHDRPFKERRIFGMVRYIGESGIRKHFDTLNYVNAIKSLK
jgi:deoxyribodipyrimidine photo-lyase